MVLINLLIKSNCYSDKRYIHDLLEWVKKWQFEVLCGDFITGDSVMPPPVSRVAQGNFTPALPQVGSRTGAVPESPFPPPASSNPTCGFPTLGFPVNFI